MSLRCDNGRGRTFINVSVAGRRLSKMLRVRRGIRHCAPSVARIAAEGSSLLNCDAAKPREDMGGTGQSRGYPRSVSGGEQNKRLASRATFVSEE